MFVLIEYVVLCYGRFHTGLLHARPMGRWVLLTSDRAAFRFVVIIAWLRATVLLEIGLSGSLIFLLKYIYAVDSADVDLTTLLDAFVQGHRYIGYTRLLRVHA